MARVKQKSNGVIRGLRSAKSRNSSQGIRECVQTAVIVMMDEFGLLKRTLYL